MTCGAQEIATNLSNRIYVLLILFSCATLAIYYWLLSGRCRKLCLSNRAQVDLAIHMHVHCQDRLILGRKAFKSGDIYGYVCDFVFLVRKILKNIYIYFLILNQMIIFLLVKYFSMF